MVVRLQLVVTPLFASIHFSLAVGCFALPWVARHLHSSGLPATVRPTDPEFAPGHSVKFADGFPLLVSMEVSTGQGRGEGREPAWGVTRLRASSADSVGISLFMGSFPVLVSMNVWTGLRGEREGEPGREVPTALAGFAACCCSGSLLQHRTTATPLMGSRGVVWLQLQLFHYPSLRVKAAPPPSTPRVCYNWRCPCRRILRT